MKFRKSILLLVVFTFLNLNSAELDLTNCSNNTTEIFIEEAIKKMRLDESQEHEKYQMVEFLKNIPFLEFCLKKPEYQHIDPNLEPGLKLELGMENFFKQQTYQSLSPNLKAKLYLELGVRYLLIQKIYPAFNMFKKVLSIAKSFTIDKYTVSEAKLRLGEIYEFGCDEIKQNEETAIKLYKSILKNPLNASKGTRADAQQRLEFIEFDQEDNYLIIQEEELIGLINEITKKIEQSKFKLKHHDISGFKKVIANAKKLFNIDYRQKLLSEENFLQTKTNINEKFSAAITALININNKIDESLAKAHEKELEQAASLKLLEEYWKNFWKNIGKIETV